MAKRKNLKSVAYSFQHSFMSMMNYWEFYIEDLLSTALLEHNQDTFTLNIKTKEVLPKDLKNIEPFQKSIEFYCDIFLPRLVKNMGFDYDETIKEAKMSIKFDFQDKVYRSDGVFCIGFIANTILIDEFEKIYSKDYESKVILSLETIDEVKERYFTKNKESENRFVDYN
mgnify:CR=1 FL=1